MNGRPGAKVNRVTLVFGIFAAVVALYWPTLVALGGLWSDSARTTYTHGYLVAGIALWMVWRARDAIAQPDTAPLGDILRAWLMALLLAVTVGWQLAYRAGLQLGVEILLLPLLWLPVWLLVGRNAARATWLPLGFLVFALPFWDALTPLLQFASVQASRFILRLVGIPAFFHGNSVEIPAGVFQIEGGCSGLHYLVVSLAVATLIGQMRDDRWPRRLGWLLLAAILALIVNWFRVASIIYIGHVTHMQNYLVRVSHYAYGWMLFALALLLLFLIERRTPLAPARHPAPGSAEFTFRVPRAAQAACVLVLALPTLVNLIVSARLDTAPTGSRRLAGEGWHRVDGIASEWQPVQNNADQQRRQQFMRGGIAVESYVAEYREQRLGKKLGGYANRPQGAAEVLEAGTLSADRDTGYMVIEQNGRRSMLLLTYRVADRDFASANRAQLWYSWLTLRSLLSPLSEVIAWRADCNPDCDRARELLLQFLPRDGS